MSGLVRARGLKQLIQPNTALTIVRARKSPWIETVHGSIYSIKCKGQGS